MEGTGQQLRVGEEIEETGYYVAGILSEAGIVVSVDIEPVGSNFTSWESRLPKGNSRGYCLVPGQTRMVAGKMVTLKSADENTACFEVTEIKKK